MIRVLVVDDDYHVAKAHALSVGRLEGFTVVGKPTQGPRLPTSWRRPGPT
jgi:response regulator of citrate/malate metabolism